MEFWTFASGDPELLRFCDSHAGDDALYCILCIEECLKSYSAETMELLHLRDGALLLIEPPLLPLYARVQLKGHFIMLSEAFCTTAQTQLMFKFVFFHRTPEGMIDGGNLNEEQKACLALLCDEYRCPHDELQPPLLRNLVRNLLLFSDCTHTVYLTAGHLLGYALQLLDLLKVHAAREKRKSFYAEKIGITENFLNHVVHAVFGRSFRDMLIQQVLISSMKPLIASERTVAQIAHELDYDATGFNRLFYKWKGLYPKESRERYRRIVKEVEHA